MACTQYLENPIHRASDGHSTLIIRYFFFFGKWLISSQSTSMSTSLSYPHCENSFKQDDKVLLNCMILWKILVLHTISHNIPLVPLRCNKSSITLLIVRPLLNCWFNFVATETSIVMNRLVRMWKRPKVNKIELKLNVPTRKLQI